MTACSVLAQAAGTLGLFTLARLQSRVQLAKIAGLAAIFCTSLACGNAALRYIPVSFVQVLHAQFCAGHAHCKFAYRVALAQMLGATTPMFTAVLGLLITGIREEMFVYISLIPIVAGAPLCLACRAALACQAFTRAGLDQAGRDALAAGMGMAAGGEPSFHLLGFLLEIAATCSRALKSIVQVLCPVNFVHGLGC